jgi:CBS domain-containing protein
MPEEYLVRDYMVSPVTAVPETTSLLDAVLLMRRSGFRHLPVVNGERLVGIITDRDLSRLAPSMLGKPSPLEYNEIFENTPLAKVMTRNPITVTPDSRVLDAVAILHHKKLGCLPVVENGRLVGIITVTDMLGLLLRVLVGAVASEIEIGEA